MDNINLNTLDGIDLSQDGLFFGEEQNDFQGTSTLLVDQSTNEKTETSNNEIIVDQSDTSSQSNNANTDVGVVEDNFLVVDTFESGSERDSYQFEVGQKSNFDFSLDNLDANLDLSIADNSGNILYSSAESGTQTESISAELETGEYVAYITAEEDVETDYSFSITQSSSSEESSESSDTETSNNDDSSQSDAETEPLISEGDTVYRFFRTDSLTQFYTTSEEELASVQENLPQYEYQGESFVGAPNPEENDDITGVVPVYRFFNTNTGVHLYTASIVEKDAILENLPNYTDEGISYYGYESQQEDTVALYRFYNASLDAHFYTPSIEERDEYLASSDYQPEGDENGVAFYVESIEI